MKQRFRESESRGKMDRILSSTGNKRVILVENYKRVESFLKGLEHSKKFREIKQKPQLS